MLLELRPRAFEVDVCELVRWNSLSATFLWGWGAAVERRGMEKGSCYLAIIKVIIKTWE